ncbi:MAG: glycosyltransferase [Methyloprofundus sp.]|nr:glycosyltransferase [Methyloprofundus sp.]
MLYIFLPVHNRRDITKFFIESLCKQTNRDFQLVLIDDGSVDGTAEMVMEHIPNTVVIKGNGNLWWGGALQEAYKWLYKHLTNEPCLLINDDTVIGEEFIEVGTRLLQDNPKTLILAQSFSLKSGQAIDKGVHYDYKKLSFRQAKDQSEINCLSTRGLFLNADDFKIIGGFYPKLLPHYLSDYEFTIRAFNKGFNLLTTDELHLKVNEETTGLHGIKFERFKSYYKKFFSNRNASNPRHWMIFVLLTAPLPYKILNIFRVCLMGLKGVLHPFKVLITSIK